MASYTSNLNLKKPSGSENVAIGDINNNMDLIDTAYGEIMTSVQSKTVRASGIKAVISIPSNGRHFFIITGAGLQRYAVILVNSASDGSETIVEIYKGNSVTLTTDANTVTYTIAGSSNTSITVSDFALQGNLATVAIS